MGKYNKFIMYWEQVKMGMEGSGEEKEANGVEVRNAGRNTWKWCTFER